MRRGDGCVEIGGGWATTGAVAGEGLVGGGDAARLGWDGIGRLRNDGDLSGGGAAEAFEDDVGGKGGGGAENNRLAAG